MLRTPDKKKSVGLIHKSSSVSVEPVSIAREFLRITTLSHLNTKTVPTLFEMVDKSYAEHWEMVDNVSTDHTENACKHQMRILDITEKLSLQVTVKIMVHRSQRNK